MKKDREEKFRIIDNLLQLNRGYTIREMMDELNVTSTTTIKSLLGFKNGTNKGIRNGERWPDYLLEKYDPDKLDILKEVKNSTTGEIRYSYSKSDFSLFKDELEHHVIESLLPILEHLNQMEGVNDLYIDQLFDIYDVLERQRDGAYKNRIEELQSQEKIIKSESKKIFTLEDDFVNPNFIGIICSAIHNKQALQIKYKSFNDGVSKIICHPYKMAQSQNRWYLICLVNSSLDKENEFTINKRIGKINNLPTERIQSIDITESEYINSKIDIFKYLDKTIGVSIDWQNPEIFDLKIQVNDNLVKYFETNPLINLGSTNKGNVFTYNKVIKSLELKNKILSYGSNIKILEPISFKEEIKKEIEKMNSIY